jgi:stage V sporulation protein G
MDTESVNISILNLQPVHSKTVYALMDVEIVIHGVAVVLHGVQARHVSGGGSSIHTPTYRAADGSWKTAVTLPRELVDAISDNILRYMLETGVARARYSAEVA